MDAPGIVHAPYRAAIVCVCVVHFLWTAAGQSLIWSAVFDVAAIAIYTIAPLNEYRDAIYLLIAITLSAGIKGIIFPIVHYVGSMRSKSELGASISNVYAANVAGATIGPLFVGFVLLNIASLQQSMLICSLAALLVWLVVSRKMTGATHKWLAGIAGIILALGLGIADKHLLIYELVAREHGRDLQVDFINESRNGTVHTLRDEVGDVVVFGENLYDGKINTNLARDINMINRVYALAALQPNPKKILVIGLSGGSWVEVVRHFPNVESIEVVEINPNYLKLVQSQSEVAPLLSDPRITIHITDGRKYLRNSNEKYDLIVMNASWHWRAYNSLLLGQEFMVTLRDALEPNGVIAFNTTGSMDVLNTAAEVFPFAGLYSNFVFASDHDLRPDLRSNALRIEQVAMAVNRTTGADVTYVRDAAIHAATTPIWLVSEFKHDRPPEVVTERNMIIEYKYGRGFIH